MSTPESQHAWPKEASNLQFHISGINLTGKDESSLYCRILYIEERNSIDIVDWNDKSLVLDSFQLDDVIGADMELVACFDENKFDQHDVNELVKNIDNLDSTWNHDNNNINSNNDELIDEKNINIVSSATNACISSISTTKAFLNIYSYPRKKGKKDRISHHVSLQVAVDHSNSNSGNNDWSSVESCIRGIRLLAKLGQFGISPSKPPCYLLVVNPFSGTGNGRHIYDNMVKDMLDQAGVDHRLLITQHAGHATERMSERTLIKSPPNNNNNINILDDCEESDISYYDAIIVMGGDGILSEVLQGIHRRPDAQTILATLKFGIVGCGTCNGLAKSIQHASSTSSSSNQNKTDDVYDYYSIRESIFLICKGQSSPMDLSLFQTSNKKQQSYLGFLTFSWAMISDIDIESEIIRFVGSLRMELWTVWRIINLKTYHGRFSYLPPPSSSSSSYVEQTSNISINDKLTPEWKTIEDEFLLLWVSQVSHASHTVHNSPTSKLNDGLFKALIIRKNKCTRFKLVTIMLQLDYGTHEQHEECEVYDCIAFRFEPLTVGSYNNLDGERIEDGIVHAQVLPSAIQSFANIIHQS